MSHCGETEILKTEKLKGLDSMINFFEVTKGTIVTIVTVVTIVPGVTVVTVMTVVSIASIKLLCQQSNKLVQKRRN